MEKYKANEKISQLVKHNKALLSTVQELQSSLQPHHSHLSHHSQNPPSACPDYQESLSNLQKEISQMPVPHHQHSFGPKPDFGSQPQYDLYKPKEIKSFDRGKSYSGHTSPLRNRDFNHQQLRRSSESRGHKGHKGYESRSRPEYVDTWGQESRQSERRQDENAQTNYYLS